MKNQKTADINRRAAFILLQDWTYGRISQLDPARIDDVQALVKLHRGGKLFTKGGDLKPEAYVKRRWPSGNEGTAARLLGVYNNMDLTDPSDIQGVIEAAVQEVIHH